MNRQTALIMGAVITLAMVLVSLMAFTALPSDAQIPLHWSAGLEADGFVSRTLGLWLLPAVMAAMVLLLWVAGPDGNQPDISSKPSIQGGLLMASRGLSIIAVLVALASLGAVHAFAVLTALQRPSLWLPFVLSVAVAGLASQVGLRSSARESSGVDKLATVLTFGSPPKVARRLLWVISWALVILVLNLPA